ncbi:MAG: Crp/Fnr family transcriptional regulator [Acetobacteraceae bacterium]|nr:Crp/Fnr family transcriptional regulator [Acetobacteraceae bacterium]
MPTRSAWDASGPKREVLAASDLFRVLTDAERDAVIAQAVTRRIARNVPIVRKGDPGSSAIVIMSGRVRISMLSPEGREFTLGVLGPGEVIGEMSLIDGGPRSADVTAIEDCVLLAVPRNRFLALLHENPDLCLRVMQVLCQRLRRANQSLEEVATLDLPARLGRLLLRLAKEHGRPTPEGIRIDLRLSQKDLSTLIAGSREKVNRELRHWEAAGAIVTKRGYILIRRPEVLSCGAKSEKL